MSSHKEIGSRPDTIPAIRTQRAAVKIPRETQSILTAWLNLGVSAKGITADSRQVAPGWVFAALAGQRQDGRSFIAEAIARGAAAVFWESGDSFSPFIWSNAWAVPNLPVSQLEEHLGFLAAAIYGHPSQNIWTIGVTGTNGKTSCTHWIAQALQQTGLTTAVIGTVGNGFLASLETTSYTTPEAPILQGLLADYRQQGVQALAIEVSSHGLALGRVNGMHFDVALFTNLTHDHLDFHGTMVEYAAAKARLMAWPGLRTAVIRADVPYGAEMQAVAVQQGHTVLTYGFSSEMMLRGSQLQLSARGLRMQVDSPWGSAVLDSPLLGEFNAANLLGVLGVLLASEVSWSTAVDLIRVLRPVPGRLQRVYASGAADQRPGEPLVVVDYAHTPDALEKVLQTLKALLPTAEPGRLWCVFGCGGDRDPAKRPLMGAIAARLADRVIVTSDNPRSEDPEKILADIWAGIPSEQRGSLVQPVLNRGEAIREAIHAAGGQDIVLIAGKGHETYQEIAGKRFPFSDVAEAEVALAKRQDGKVSPLQEVR